MADEQAISRQIREKLDFIYGPEKGSQTWVKLAELLDSYREKIRPSGGSRFSEKDVILITYGDQVQEAGQHPLQTLHTFLNRHLKGTVNTIHILPFYPYTSDDGFSVVDYRQVNPDLGDWEDIEALRAGYKLMFDAVINHISASSTWFQGFLAGEETYRDYFITTDPTLDLSGVTRPRTLPLLTAFDTLRGPEYVWTTFSADQIDLNFANPAVLLEITEILLFYVSRGASLIRLDAIGYLWKEIGTSCIHLPQTHAVVQLWRNVLDLLAPQVLLVTETNVPHRDNISYFGNGINEAQMVYQFPLVPLVLNALQTGNARHLQKWAAELEPPSASTTFFNFLASHDGMGVVPARGILSEQEVQALVDQTLAHSGKVSYKNNPDGSQSPYELNITLFDWLSDPANSEESLELKVSRFLASQAILLVLQGIPGIYFHSFLGSPNWQEGLGQTGRARTLNRQKLTLPELEAKLNQPGSREAQVMERLKQLIALRTSSETFHPESGQEILDIHPHIFALKRFTKKAETVVLINLSATQQAFDLSKISGYKEIEAKDLLNNKFININARLDLLPYQIVWINLDKI